MCVDLRPFEEAGIGLSAEASSLEDRARHHRSIQIEGLVAAYKLACLPSLWPHFQLA
jgi:hypothetical protein